MGEGYAPQAAELDQLFQIDAKLQLLLPVQEFLSVRGPYGYRFSQVCAMFLNTLIFHF